MRNFGKIFAAVLLLGSVAQAKDIKFEFRVNSSGNSIYACNAGLMQPPGQRSCYWYGLPGESVCDPAVSCPPGQESTCKCVCNGVNGGDNLANYFRATFGNWADDKMKATDIQTVVKNTRDNYPSTSYTRLFDDQHSWDKMLTSLEFNLGSELYGASYFVDICFRGSQIDYTGTAAPHLLDTGVTITDILRANHLSYTHLAGLQMRIIAACDRQDEGDFKETGDDSLLNEVNMNGPTGKQLFVVKNWGPVSTGYTHGINQYINNVGYSPRFCKIRYEFRENAVNNWRMWQRHDAQVCTHTLIEESSGEPTEEEAALF